MFILVILIENLKKSFINVTVFYHYLNLNNLQFFVERSKELKIYKTCFQVGNCKDNLKLRSDTIMNINKAQERTVPEKK